MLRRARASRAGAAQDGQRLRVLLLNWRDLTHPEGGGSELYVQSVAAELAKAGHAVTLFCAAHDGAPALESRDGYRIVRRGSRLSVYPRAALAWWSGRLGRADVIVDVQNGMPFFAALWSRRPVVVLVHHVHRELWPIVMPGARGRLGWWIESRLAPAVHRRCEYVAVSKATHDELARLGVPARHITVVRNGTPVRAVDQARSQEPEICVLGRLVPHKRVEHAIRAVAALRASHPGLRLTVVGDGYWAPQLRELVQQLGIDDAVTFTGFVDDETKHRLLARAWLLAMPSVKEGWALSVVEAATHGTPAVAFRDAGGVSESVVDGTTGLLVDDEAGFVAAVEQLLDEPATRERLGRAAAARAVAFTWAATGAAFGEVLQRVARTPAATVEQEPGGVAPPVPLPVPRGPVDADEMAELVTEPGTANAAR